MNIQLANTYNPSKNYHVSHWYASPKFDGVRAVFTHENGFVTRNNKALTGFENITKILENICMARGLSFIDGELIISGKTFQEIQGVVLSANHKEKLKAEFHVFAVGGDFQNTADMLNAIPNIPEAKIFKVNSEIIENNYQAIEQACEKFTGLGYEGVMLRDPNVCYFNGRNDYLLKYKFFNEADLKIIGINQARRSLTVEGEINGKKVKCSVTSSLAGEECANIIGQFLSVKYQSFTDRPNKEGFYSLRFPSEIGIKADRDFKAKEVQPKSKSQYKPADGITYGKYGFVEAVFNLHFSLSSLFEDNQGYSEATLSAWKEKIYTCKSIKEGQDLIKQLKLTIPDLMQFAKYIGVSLSGCQYLKAEIIRWIITGILQQKG